MAPQFKYVLGIESSCDETAAAVLLDGHNVLSNVVASQVALHRPFGGVVPELAARQHIANIIPIVRESLYRAGIDLNDIQGIAVTKGPGLVGALLVGVQVAKAIALARSLPFIGVNHLEGHLCAPYLSDSSESPPERHLALLVSGGHTALFLVEGFGHYRRIGTTRDDAAGEAFDKVSKLLGLGYPGGPIVERLASKGRANAIHFPRALPGKTAFDFSFSGLKTAVAQVVKKEFGDRSRDKSHALDERLYDLCASFQQAVADVLVEKTVRAAEHLHVDTIVASGGVLANKALRRQLEQHAADRQLRVILSPLAYCTDNAAMIAAAGARRLELGERSDMTLNAVARLPLTPPAPLPRR